jgi:hypothetical protein
MMSSVKFVLILLPFHTVALHDMNQVPVTKIDTVNVTQIELVQEEYKITEI